MIFKPQLLRHSKNLSLKYLPSKKVLVIDGPQGTFLYSLNYEFNYSNLNRKFWLFPNRSVDKSSFFLSQVLLVRSCIGATLGYRCQLNLVGIGFSASIEKEENLDLLVLKLGFSHIVKMRIPSFLFVSCPKPKTIMIKGINLQKVNSFAALLKDLKQPNPYKEKGLYYKNEVPKLKQGKKT